MNSYDVPERIEITGKPVWELELAEDAPFNVYDFRVDDYIERNERRQLREVISAEIGYRRPDGMSFLRDMLQSDRHFSTVKQLQTDNANLNREMKEATRQMNEGAREMAKLEKSDKTTSVAYREAKGAFESAKKEIADYRARIEQNNKAIDENNKKRPNWSRR
jgi:chromosome segregation ATPase